MIIYVAYKLQAFTCSQARKGKGNLLVLIKYNSNHCTNMPQTEPMLLFTCYALKVEKYMIILPISLVCNNKLIILTWVMMKALSFILLAEECPFISLISLLSRDFERAR